MGRHSRQRVSRRARLALSLAILVTAATAAWYWVSVSPLSGQGTPVEIHVVSGEGISGIAADLEAHGVISSALAFRVDSLVFGAPLIRPGYYVIRTNSSDGEVRRVFGSLPNANVLNVSAGMTIRQIVEQAVATFGGHFALELQNQFRVRATTNAFGAPSLEGLLGTGAYVVRRDESAAELIGEMQRRFVRQAAQAGLTTATRVQGLNAYQIITAASIVEKEGYYPKNMPKVGRVILNRLRRGGGLQMDATVLYYLGLGGGKVTHAMLRLKTPYNTYLHPGLTPTPICQISTFAMQAILHAPPGDWLYFVVIDKYGNEAFATTFKEQLANERLAASRGL